MSRPPARVLFRAQHVADIISRRVQRPGRGLHEPHDGPGLHRLRRA